MVHSINVVKNVTDKIPVRLNVGLMLFMACLSCYMLRVNLSINILAMVAPPPHTNTTKPTELPDYGPRYEWSAHDQSFLLGAYFWGYLVTSLPGGVLAERYGGRNVVGLSMAAATILTGIFPVAAHLGYWWCYAVRIVIGIVGGVLYPALHNIVSKWAPPEEKGKFIAMLLGGTFGTVITWPLCGILVETIGWVWAFYIPAVISGIITIIWYYIVTDTPSNHPRISVSEREYIEKSLSEFVSKGKAWPPVAKVLTSLPFWSLMVLHYGNLWGLYFLITAAPKFMNEILGFNLAKAGILSALPYLARAILGFAFGSIGDVIRKKELMSVTMIRKLFCVFSHVIPGLFLVGIGFIGFKPYVCVAIITLSLGFNGASTLTNLQNSQDLAPNFAGTLYGIMNFVGTTSGFISPIVVAYFTADENTIEQWTKVFFIGAAAYIGPAIIFGIFGSGQVQKWNEPKVTKDAETSTN